MCCRACVGCMMEPNAQPSSHIKALDLSLEQRKMIGTQQRNDALSQTTRVRGLKWRIQTGANRAQSRTNTVRGLKSGKTGRICGHLYKSHPTRVRGLKYYNHLSTMINICRTTQVCGLKWTKGFITFSSESRTRMGAWIEICPG